MNKLYYARYIHQILYNLPYLPSEDHPAVVRRARNTHKEILKYQFEMAIQAEQSKKEQDHA